MKLFKIKFLVLIVVTLIYNNAFSQIETGIYISDAWGEDDINYSQKSKSGFGLSLGYNTDITFFNFNFAPQVNFQYAQKSFEEHSEDFGPVFKMFDETYLFELNAKFNYPSKIIDPYIGLGIGVEKYLRDVFYSSGIGGIDLLSDLSEYSLSASVFAGIKIHTFDYLYPFFEIKYARFNYDDFGTVNHRRKDIRNDLYLVNFGISFKIAK